MIRVETISELLKEAASARRENRLGDAHREYTEAVDRCRKEGTRRELIQALKGVAQTERDLGRLEAAVPPYEEAVALCRRENDPQMLAHTVRHLGDVYRHEGRAADADSCYNEALAIYRSRTDTAVLDLANAVRPLAILKSEAGDVGEAVRLWKEAKELYAQANVPPGVDECTRRLAQMSASN